MVCIPTKEVVFVRVECAEYAYNEYYTCDGWHFVMCIVSCGMIVRPPVDRIARLPVAWN